MPRVCTMQIVSSYLSMLIVDYKENTYLKKKPDNHLGRKAFRPITLHSVGFAGVVYTFGKEHIQIDKINKERCCAVGWNKFLSRILRAYSLDS